MGSRLEQRTEFPNHLTSSLLRKVGCDPLSKKKAAFKLEAKSLGKRSSRVLLKKLSKVSSRKLN